MHLCIGAPLSRLKAASILVSLLGRFPRLELTQPEAEIDWGGGPSARAPVQLSLTGYAD